MDDVLISKAAAIDALKRAAYWQDAERKIAELPAVDAVPVVHARWVDEDYPYKDANANPRVTAICSKCGNIAHRMEHGYSIFSKHCPNCGAKMDGERRDSECQG